MYIRDTGETPSEHKKSGNKSRSPLYTVFPNINKSAGHGHLVRRCNGIEERCGCFVR